MLKNYIYKVCKDTYIKMKSITIRKPTPTLVITRYNKIRKSIFQTRVVSDKIQTEYVVPKRLLTEEGCT